LQAKPLSRIRRESAQAGPQRLPLE
jgi:hypothetical protein